MAKIYFRVIGYISKDEQLRLGFTSSPKAWARNPNGWKLEELRFVPMLGTPKKTK